MTESRKGRTKRPVSTSGSKTQDAEMSTADPQWVRERRPVLPPLRVGREWDRIRRIAYL